MIALKSAWEVFLLFLIPVGGGIPGGVLLARTRGIAWPIMMLLYFISDVVLACVFEPLMKTFIFIGRHVSFLGRFIDLMRKTVRKSASYYGTKTGPIALVMISFGVDPMTGRAAARAAGHGFVTGWLIAITGDMIYFTLLMVSTLWLSDVLGDGNLAMTIILVLMIGIPWAIRRIRKALSPNPQ
ncbi:MAG: hypothetical protein ABIR96_11965 [Bdellovibrionota bacterium]